MTRFLLPWVLACGWIQAGAQPQARIELLPQARVGGEQVVLGQVAHLQTADLPTMRALVDLPLGPAPRPGEAAAVRRNAVMDWVARRSGIDPAHLAWAGTDETRVERASQSLAGERIAEAAAGAWRAWLAQRGTPAAVLVRRPPRDVELPVGELRLDVRIPEPAVPRPHVHAWVDVSVGGRLARSVPVLLELEGVATVATRLPAAGARRTDALPIAVSRGDWAALHTAAGAVSLESRVEVLQDGRVGDKVRVRTRGATALVLARVVAPGQLELAP